MPAAFKKTNKKLQCVSTSCCLVPKLPTCESQSSLQRTVKNQGCFTTQLTFLPLCTYHCVLKINKHKFPKLFLFFIFLLYSAGAKKSREHMNSYVQK